MGRKLTFNIFRLNPMAENDIAKMQKFELEETDAMTLFIALNRIREEQDPSLNFDFVCRAAICGTCAMLINGKPGLACHTKTKDLPKKITLMPLPVFKLIGDLAVDTGVWFRAMNESVQSWIHTKTEFDPNAKEERMSNDKANEIFELDRCIECGCCIAACGKANMRPDFIGAAALNRIARFMVDPRDQREDKEYFEVFSHDEGIFGCLGLLGCEDVCPKDIPLLDQLAYLRRKAGWDQIKGLFRANK